MLFDVIVWSKTVETLFKRSLYLEKHGEYTLKIMVLYVHLWFHEKPLTSMQTFHWTKSSTRKINLQIIKMFFTQIIIIQIKWLF